MTTTKHEAAPAVAKPSGGAGIGKIVTIALGPVLAVACYLLLPADLNGSAKAVAAVTLWMAFWWMTEAIPLPATSLLPLVLLPTFGVADVNVIAQPYAGSVIFLILGGVLLGLATQKWDLHRRIALMTILAVGTRPDRIVLGLMIASAFISMWVSNTATAVIMVPIAVSILNLIRSLHPDVSTKKLTASMLLGVAYAVTIGSMATLIGQPTMPLMRGYLEESHGITLGFGQWMLVGVPFGIVMLTLAWLVLTKLVYRSEMDEIPRGRALIREQLDELGPLSTEEKRVIWVFGGAIFCWLVLPFVADIDAVESAMPWVARINDTSVAVLAAILMLVLPASASAAEGKGRTLLDWSDTKDVPWGVLILIGSGLTLSAQFTATGLSDWIGESVANVGDASPVVLILVVAVVLLALTELTSNVATAAAFLPVMGAVAVGAGMDPLLMTVAVTVAVSSAYMLPSRRRRTRWPSPPESSRSVRWSGPASG